MREYRPGGQGFRAALIRGLCRVFVWPTLAWWPLRGPLATLIPLVNLVMSVTPRLRSTRMERVVGASWRGELVRPHGPATRAGALLYLHGGAFVFCGLATHRRIVERLALRTGLPVLSVEYRQLPRARLDESLADVIDAFRWLVDNGHDGSIVCVGDSAGGHLAFALALAAEKAGVSGPAGVVGLSPWLDFDSRTKQAHPNSRKDVFIPTRRLSRVARLCTGTQDRDIDPLRSPVNGTLGCLPPVLLLCAEDEVLRCDAELMAERLEAADVEYKIQIWQGQVHAFPVLGHFLPESRAAIDEIAHFVDDVV
nr:alpha/beta hydrolase [Kibdelosporangium sp. MJ126-NF4]CEL22756.1 putative esterase [Kibdelosporangium sp. MJ126-NF4]CTQ89895.1 putative esterase [Kibdelosporangium sp. MJ126-NF4]